MNQIKQDVTPSCTFLGITADILLDFRSSPAFMTECSCRQGALQGLVTWTANMVSKVPCTFPLVTSLAVADTIFSYQLNSKLKCLQNKKPPPATKNK